MEDLGAMLNQAKDAITDSYQMNRIPAKEVLLGAVGGLDRIQSPTYPGVPYSIPMMYYMGGYSLKMSSVRGQQVNRSKA